MKPSNQDSLKLITVNIWEGGKLLDNLLEFLEREKPDILLCQEVYNATASDLSPRFRSMKELERLNFPYSLFAPAGIWITDDGCGEQGNAIFSRFPLTAESKTYFYGKYVEIEDNLENRPHLPRIIQHATAETPLGELNLLNIHGVYDLDGDSFSESRQKMGEKILATAKPLSNVIIAGDTNAPLSNQMIKEIAKVYPSALAQNPPKTTFNMKRKTNPGYASVAVDNIFASPNLRFENTSVPDVDISDHLPVITHIMI